MDNDYPNLDACNPRLCYSGRVMRMERIISSVFRKHISPFNLTNSQLSILFVTAKRGIVTQKALSEILFLEKSSVSRNLKRLLQSELIENIDAKKIAVTDKGKQLLEQVIPEWDKAMEEVREILGDNGQSSFNTLYEIITKK